MTLAIDTSEYRDYLRDLHFDEEDFVEAIRFWTTRYKEHCLVLLFYLQTFTEPDFQGTPLGKEKNGFRTRAFSELKAWTQLEKNVASARDIRSFSSNLLEYNQQLRSLLQLKQEILQQRRQGRHPGPQSLGLLVHMHKEGKYIESLLNRTLTLDAEYTMAMEEMVEHTQYLAQQIEPIDSKHKQTIGELLALRRSQRE